MWNDVELLDGRFAEGDAVRVLARVEKFRDRLQLDVRSLESADVDPQTLTPALRRDRDELDGFLDFLVAELTHPGLRATVEATLGDRDLGVVPGDARGPPLVCRWAARAHGRRRDARPRDGAAPPAAAQRPAARRGARPRRRPHARARAGAGVLARPPKGGCSGTCTSGCRLVEERAEGLSSAQLAELLHCVAVHHDARGARTAEAAVLYHANQLDAVAATRKVD